MKIYPTTKELKKSNEVYYKLRYIINLYTGISPLQKAILRYIAYQFALYKTDEMVEDEMFYAIETYSINHLTNESFTDSYKIFIEYEELVHNDFIIREFYSDDLRTICQINYNKILSNYSLTPSAQQIRNNNLN